MAVEKWQKTKKERYRHVLSLHCSTFLLTGRMYWRVEVIIRKDRKEA
jgi:hypothetical protein